MAEGRDAIVIGLGTAVAGAIIVGLSKHIANVVVGDPRVIDEQKFEEMHRRLEGKSFHISKPLVQDEPVARVGSKVVGRAVRKKSAPVMDYIHDSIQQLEEAKKSTKCGVCLKEIDASIASIKDHSQIIVRADSKQQIIEDLKAAGKLPKNARWDKLNSEQRKFINNYVERSIANGI